MSNAALLWLIPLAPLLGSLVLTLGYRALGRRVAAVVGVGAVGIAALAAAILAAQLFTSGSGPVPGAAEAWLESRTAVWLAVDRLSVSFGLRLDALSLVMVLVISGVGFLIHLYSTVYMAGDESFTRFFAYMNLFMAAMLVLVLADDLLLLYLGWEGVGLCSYLLIGFWYRDAANGYAARKAFVVTRIGDTAMVIGLLLLATQLGTLEIGELSARAAAQWPVGSGVATAAAALLLGGALGKSAQLPLQTWLPDAMAGPTPVSALIHAATMVTAGVYLIARMHTLFELAPAVQLAVAVIGAATLVLAALAALAQRDIKRVLAYSTMSQIGYMFLALGVGAWTAAVFHFVTHAVFKALLFLAAGALILALHHEQDMFRMGGLRKRLPGVFAAFAIGAAALAAVPLVTSGFYSKEQILTGAWGAQPGGRWLWLAGVAAALLTSVYISRAVFIVFFGAPRAGDVAPRRGLAIALPLGLLALLSLVVGFVETPANLGHVTLLSDFLANVLPGGGAEHGGLGLELAAAAASLGGIALGWWLYFPRGASRPAGEAGGRGAAAGWLASGLGFDRLYDAIAVRPFVATARALRADVLDRIYAGVARLLDLLWRAGSATQTGALRWYVAGMLAGVVVVIAVTVLT